MAKAKSAKTAKSTSASTKKAKKSAEATGISASTPGNSRSAKGEFTHIAIGHAAGDVWGVLSNDGPKSIAELKKSVNAPGDVVVAAVGWLAREDKLEYVANGKTVKIGLR